jgi:hypothetical protein
MTAALGVELTHPTQTGYGPLPISAIRRGKQIHQRQTPPKRGLCESRYALLGLVPECGWTVSAYWSFGCAWWDTISQRPFACFS